MTTLSIPDRALVLLLGPSGAGKSTFAARHFAPTEIVSSDRCRAMVADDETAQEATYDAFALLHFIVRRRLARGLLTVVDATNVKREARAPLLGLARELHLPAIAIALDLPEGLCQARNAARPGRDFGPHVVEGHCRLLRASLPGLRGEGFAGIFVLGSSEAVDAVTIARVPAAVDRRAERGPFDVIGDVHGCFVELVALLEKLGYGIEERLDPDGRRRVAATPPPGRKAVFVGDLVDRGPGVPDVLRLVMDMVAAGHALCVPGNHDVKLCKKLRGRDVRVAHGLAESLAQLGAEPPALAERVTAFVDGLPSHLVLDGGRLVVAHAGLPAALQGRDSDRVRAFALYGATTGEIDEYGLPVRLPWARGYRGEATVVHGHTPVLEPAWVNRTIGIDTGCVFGGRLTALRYPERELVSVPATAVHCPPARPLARADEPARVEGPPPPARAPRPAPERPGLGASAAPPGPRRDLP